MSTPTTNTRSPGRWPVTCSTTGRVCSRLTAGPGTSAASTREHGAAPQRQRWRSGSGKRASSSDRPDAASQPRRHHSTDAHTNALPGNRRRCLPRSAAPVRWGHRPRTHQRTPQHPPRTALRLEGLPPVVVTALASASQHYLDEARQMQALSFAVHIPLVCFGIAFPAMVLFAEWVYLRTGDELYRTLARRWTRVMVALFAVGVVTGTILSF